MCADPHVLACLFGAQENDKGKEPQVVSFYVYDWDRFGGDDPLGHFHLKIDTIPFEREYTFRMELEDVTRGWLVVKVWKSTLGPPVDGDDSKCGKVRRGMRRVGRLVQCRRCGAS